MRQLEIIYEDMDIILCHKPAGLATQTKRIGQQDMESLLRNYRVKKGEESYVGIVHRLDQPVEGIMVFAKNPKAAAAISKQITEDGIGKRYYALCRPENEIEKQGTLTDYLLTDKKQNYTSVVDKNTPKAKKAVLDYKAIRQDQRGVLLDIQLHTGRQHQIRVQLSHAGLPIIGDSKYGVKDENNRLHLCSYELSFLHPTTGKKVTYSIPLPF